MSLSAVQFLSVFLVPTLLGIGLLHSLGIRLRDDRLAFFGWAYTAGSFGTGAVLFAWLWLGWPLDARLLAPALLLLAAALGFIGSRTDHTAADSERPPARPIPGQPRGLAPLSTSKGEENPCHCESTT